MPYILRSTKHDLAGCMLVEYNMSQVCIIYSLYYPFWNIVFLSSRGYIFTSYNHCEQIDNMNPSPLYAVSWWHYDIDTLSVLLAINAGKSVNFAHNGQQRREFIAYFVVSLNKLFQKKWSDRWHETHWHSRVATLILKPYHKLYVSPFYFNDYFTARAGTMHFITRCFTTLRLHHSCWSLLLVYVTDPIDFISAQTNIVMW